MAVFTDILPPPQSLENLTNWGDLDSLLWSLDSEVWESAGIYGLVVSEPSKNSSSFSSHITRCLTLSGSSRHSGNMSGIVIAGISGNSLSKSKEKLSIIRVHNVSCKADAKSSASDIFLRISPLMVSEPAISDGNGIVTRVRTTGIYAASAEASVGFDSVRVREISSSSATAARSIIEFYRIRMNEGASSAYTSEVMEGSRFYGMVAIEAAESCEECSYVRVLQNDFFAYSVSNNTFLGGRLLGLNCPSLSVTFGVATLSRLLEIEASGQGIVFSVIYPEYKGWGWREQKIEGGQWANKSTGTSEWSNLNYSDNVEWNALESGQNDWNQIPGGSSRWRGVVEWQ